MAEEVQRTIAEKQKILALLKQMHLFKGIDDKSLEKIVGRFVTRSLSSDDRIFAEGQFAEGFFIVLDGHVQITRQVGKGDYKVIANMIKGDYFGESALLNRTLRTGEARALVSTQVLAIDNENFRWLLETFPLIHKDLTRVSRGYEVARRKRFEWLGEDETIHVLARRDYVILTLRMLMPVFVGLGSLVSLYYSGVFSSLTLRFIGGSGLLLALLWGLWTYIDWENDFYIVTDKRVVYVEKIVLLYDSLQEAPLETIQTIKVSTANFLQRMLGYGSVTVETFGGKIHMEHVRDPYRVETALKEYWERVNRSVKQYRDEEIRYEVRTRLGLETPKPKPPTRPIRPAPQKEPEKKSFLKDLLQVRYVEGDVITYRKHWFILAVKIWPVVLFLILLLGLIIARVLEVITIFSGSQLILAFLATVLITSPYWVYQYVDWRDDRYQLTNREVIDLEKKPFKEESRDSAPLENILSIQHKRDNIIKLLLNFGTVVIHAGNKELTFDNIYNPAAVQNEVFEQRYRRVNQIQSERDRGNREPIEKLVDLYAEYLPEYLEKKAQENAPPPP